MTIDEYIRSEVERQHSTNIAGMSRAYVYLTTNPETDISTIAQRVAFYVEDQEYHHAWGVYSNLRTSHVGFVGSPNGAAPTVEVRERFVRLMDQFDPNFSPEEVEVWIKTLLDIHPWTDGNGRTASLLRNLMLGKMQDPEPLPYYYGNV